MSFTITNWKALQSSSQTWNTLILGNGASVALHSGFSYSSLHSIADHAGSLSSTRPIFASLGTSNFELVLLACWHADIVNTALGAPTGPINSAYVEVRDALIHAVQQTHCAPSTIISDLLSIGVFAAQFNTVVTFNYDLTLYWAMNEYNSIHNRWFKDGFISGSFDVSWKRFRTPINGTGTTMVFFGHGSLMLATDKYGSERKIAASAPVTGSQTALLTTITNHWAAGTHVPVFVSEGTASEKLQAIGRSPYLSTVYNDVLSNVGDHVVVYGLSFSSNDLHIIEALARNPPDTLAISVFGGLSPQDQQAFCHQVLAVLKPKLPHATIQFFDSRSPGCWNN